MAKAKEHERRGQTWWLGNEYIQSATQRIPNATSGQEIDSVGKCRKQLVTVSKFSFQNHRPAYLNEMQMQYAQPRHNAKSNYE